MISKRINLFFPKFLYKKFHRISECFPLQTCPICNTRSKWQSSYCYLQLDWDKQKQPLEVFYKKGLLKNFTESTINDLCQSHLIQLQASCNFFIEHYQATGSGEKNVSLRYQPVAPCSHVKRHSMPANF